MIELTNCVGIANQEIINYELIKCQPNPYDFTLTNELDIQRRFMASCH